MLPPAHSLPACEEKFTPAAGLLGNTSCMTRVAIIEDDLPTSNQLAGWIAAARPGIQVDQWFNRDDAEAAIARERYDLVVLDIELGRERHAGVAVINAINKRHATPVLVVSAMPAAIYRSIMKAALRRTASRPPRPASLRWIRCANARPPGAASASTCR
jgi:ActR/RegA family two-component response regulator